MRYEFDLLRRGYAEFVPCATVGWQWARVRYSSSIESGNVDSPPHSEYPAKVFGANRWGMSWVCDPVVGIHPELE